MLGLLWLKRKVAGILAHIVFLLNLTVYHDGYHAATMVTVTLSKRVHVCM